MSFISNHKLFKKSHSRYRKRKVRQNHIKKSSLLIDLQLPGTHFLSYTITELESICQQIAVEKMLSSSSSTTTRLVTTCPLICLFCENLIYEPITLYCGHTYCEQCIKDEEFSLSSVNCPRCSTDIQGQIQSSVIYAREKNFSKNHLIKQILERSETLKYKRENILLCRQAQNQYANKNYQQAIDIYSNIIEKCKHNYSYNSYYLLFFF
jgi:hypothetical protein